MLDRRRVGAVLAAAVVAGLSGLAGCQTQGSLSLAQRPPMPKRLRTFDDLVALVRNVLVPGFDVAAVEKRFGKIVKWEPVSGGEVAEGDPDLTSTRVHADERQVIRLASVPRTPMPAPWSEIRAAFGEGTDRGPAALDDWSGKTRFEFAYLVGDRMGRILLTLAHSDKSTPEVVEFILCHPSKIRR